MRARRLYTKMFLSFLAVLFVTELLIFILFLAIPAQRFGRRVESFARDKVQTVKNLVEEKAQTMSGFPLAADPEVEDLVVTLGRLLEAKLWVTDAQGQVVEKSFAGPPPPLQTHPGGRRLVYQDGFELYKFRHLEFYAIIPFVYETSRTGRVHILFENWGHPPPLPYFALGLLLVGLLIALLVIPVSRPITRRINQLRQSTLQIADGDLSHRVAATGRDEIAELGRAFNQMTAKLESMINNSKELTANISHELRTPLARVRISEEMLREKLKKAGQDPLTRHLDDIVQDIDTLDVLVGRILELSKLEMRAEPMVFRPVDLGSLITKIIDKHRPVLEQRNLSLEIEWPADLTISGNPEALATAFTNLVDNAAKYTPERGTLRIAADTAEKGVRLVLTNSFDMLTEQELAAMFNPFQRGRQPRAAGSGLGLAIVKKIIEAHGGAITARDTPDGLAFIIHLPTAARVASGSSRR